jgi:hypothetical protein
VLCVTFRNPHTEARATALKPWRFIILCTVILLSLLVHAVSYRHFVIYFCLPPLQHSGRATRFVSTTELRNSITLLPTVQNEKCVAWRLPLMS